MSEPGLFRFESRIAPYADGSGYGALAIVRHSESEGVLLEIKLLGNLSAVHWPELRTSIDEMMALAEKQLASR